MNTYPAKLIRVINGSTIKTSVNLGFAVWVHNIRIHLAHIISPTGNAGDKAATHLFDILPEDFILKLHVNPSEAEGKFIASLYPHERKIYDKNDSINFKMLESGLVSKYDI